MTTYITVGDVDATLPPGWEGDGDKDRAVLEANTWLTSRGVASPTPTPDAVIQAGAALAKAAASGELYGDVEPALKRKRVKADTVESEKEWQDGAKARPGYLALVADLLRPYLPSGGGSTFAVRRA